MGNQILINQCHNTLTIFGNINNIKKAKFVLINQVLQYFNYIWQYYSKNEMKKRNILNILHMYSREKKVKETTVPNTKQAASDKINNMLVFHLFLKLFRRLMKKMMVDDVMVKVVSGGRVVMAYR